VLYEELDTDEGLGNVYNDLGVIDLNQGDYVQAQKWFEASLGIWRELNDKARTAVVLTNLGIIYHDQGRYPEALPMYEESLELNRASGNLSGTCATLINIGSALCEQQIFDAATKSLAEALNLARTLGNKKLIANALQDLTTVAIQEGRIDVAQTYAYESLALLQELNEQRDIIIMIERWAWIRALRTRWFEAAHLLGLAEARRAILKTPFTLVDRGYVAPVIERLQQELEPSTLRDVWDRGKAANLDKTIDEILNLS
jgi:tetratricopeptide (TPR) repeat protein